ncbi:glycosyl hydrolase [Ruminococcus flavefaciens]|uniref:glycosyl hydrolase n=1 Tax=Ruminococcus flavefaciens TaxID=1265 RepID=UPI0026F2EA33|nr:glycosyl hydrolase [Ruminococcus flavefaciens]MDD7516766.1 glycosyl hydrolase [Ruminococcus flavefaciens]MDY5691971.1 glycosyl hydrolase [Ruminococcus flavefaciens]
MGSKILKKAGAAVMSAALMLNGAVYSIPTVIAADAPLKFEFEDAKVTGAVTVEDEANASGGHALKMTESGSIALTVTVDEAGPYKLIFHAFGIGSDKQQNLSINGVSQGALGIPEGTEYHEIALPAIMLKAGENTVLIEKSWGWSQFDYLEVESMGATKIEAKQTTPCDQLATVETQSLMAYLADVYGKNIISGQQEIYSGGPHGLETEFEYLKDLTGHYPAIRGFDYGNFCCPLYGSDDGSTKRIIDWVKNKNGIATASFHLNVPKDFENYTIGTKMDWSNTTYTAKDTDFSPSKAATPGTKENEYYLSALKTLAAEFNKLEAEGIPVIWRPLHEAEGGGGENGSWFWWGREGSEAYKKLWIYTYTTLTSDLKCHNLIWEWNSYNFSTSENWYPGDAYVDIIGYDKYNCTQYLEENNWQPSLKHNDSAIGSTFYGLIDKYKGQKMVAMAENDCFSTVENLTSEKAGWLYFCTWYDGGSADINFLSDPVFNTKEDTIAMYQSDYCITLDELPENLYNREGITPPDPSKTTTTTTTTSDPNVTTTTAAYKFAIQKKSVIVPEEPENAVGKNMKINITGAPGASIGGGIGFGTNADDWKSIEWSGNADKDGKLELVVDISEMPASIKNCEVQVWWSNTWDAAAEKGIDHPYKIGDCEVEYLMGGAKEYNWGDANCDETVDMSDVVLVMQSLANPDKYGLKGTDKNHITQIGSDQADVDKTSKGVTSNDALRIQEYLLKKVASLDPNSK